VEKATVILKVDGGTSDEANLLVSTLIEELNTNVRGIKLDRQKEDPETLDAGTIIVSILGTQFALELAKTLHAWLMRNHSATLTFGKEGELEITGVSADNVEEIVKTKLGGASATT
jgi:glycerate-2-kinase